MSDISAAVSIFFAAVSAVKNCTSACPPSRPPPPPPPSTWQPCIPAVVKDGFPKELEGHYRVVGLDRATGAPYSGSLQITEQSGSLKLKRQVGNKVTTGSGRYMRCGTETRSLFLRVEYNSKGRKEELFCSAPAIRYQQYSNRVACSSGWKPNGSEAWFEMSPDAL
jgi:hypothetical protein